MTHNTPGLKLTDKARILADYIHAGQVDDDGTPHFDHCSAVAEIIELVAPNDENLIAAAYLHDAIEDTSINEDFIREFYNDDVALLVSEVTKDGDGNFPNLHTSRGIMLKFADRLHNLSRMSVWDDKRQKNYKLESRFW